MSRDPSRPDGWYCPATSRQTGEPCGSRAGFGTDHVGYGQCKYHGGNTPNSRKNAETQKANEAVATYGLPRVVDPRDALLEELHRTAGHVAWLNAALAAYTDKQLEAGDAEAYLELYQRERRHFADIAKTCVGVGIEERRVKLAEQQGELIASVLDGVLTELGVRDRPDVPQIVRRHLTMVATS